MTIFCISLIVTAVLSDALGLLLLFFIKNDENMLKKYESLPRSKVLGSILAAAVILWCIPNIQAIFESAIEAKYLYLIGLLAFILTVVFLDYLCARAFGVFLIFVTYYFLKMTYQLDLFLHPLFALFFLILGNFGICICAKPYWLRDLIRKLFRERSWRIACSIYLLFCLAVSTTYIALVIISRKN